MAITSTISAPTRILMIDDAAVVARILTAELHGSRDIELIGVARSIAEATEKIAMSKPDAILLDLDALPTDCNAFMAECVRNSLPVIVMISNSDSAAERALEALFQGAADVVCKPDSRQSVDTWIAVLVERVRLAQWSSPSIPANKPGPYLTRTPSASGSDAAVFAIAPGSGGFAPLIQVLMQFPADAPGAIIVQHLPPRLTSLLARRLDSLCEIDVKEAETGDRIISGRALLAPGNKHIFLRRSSTGYFVEIKDGPELAHHKPSIDLLFNSVAKAAGTNAAAAILGATASDGTQGLLNLRKAGGHTIVADHLDDLAIGDIAEQILPISEVAGAMIEMASQPALYQIAQ